jgi:hypothetical protein
MRGCVLLPLILMFLAGCSGSSTNAGMLGEWLDVDEPGAKLVITKQELIHKSSKGTEVNQYKTISPNKIVVFRKGESDVSVTFQVELTSTSLKLIAANGTRRFRRE